MPGGSFRFVKDDEYIARVRRHKPSSLVPIVAQVGASISEPGSWFREGGSVVNPWALADIARVSLVSGNEHRQPATPKDLNECVTAYWVHDEPQHKQDAVMSFLFRKASEQLRFNDSRYHSLLRTAALFAQTTPVKDLDIIRPGWFEELFGCTLSQYVGIGFIVHTLASTRGGRFDEAWLNADPSVQAITGKIPVPLIAEIVEKHFTGDVRFFQEERPDFRASALRRYTVNPLLKRPIVAGLSRERLVPVPGLIDKKISPLGIWYSAFDHWGNAFATEVGELFEQYVSMRGVGAPRNTPPP